MNDKFIDYELRQQLNEQSFLGVCQYSDVPIPFVTIIYINKYPGFYYEAIHRHFIRTCQDCKATQIWLSIDDKPLQWHIPFCAQIVNDQEERKILVNYKKRPQNVIPMEMKLYQELKTRYFWTLKQASMITFKEKSQFQIFQKVSIEQQDKMFQNYSDVSLQMEFYEKFDNVWDLKVLQKEQSLNLALRIFYNDIYIQKGHKFEADETIGDLLINLFNDDKWLENITIYVHGLKLEKETKLRLLFLHLYSPDGFCYMLIVDN